MFYSFECGMVGKFVCAVMSVFVIGPYVFVAQMLGYVSYDFMIQCFYASVSFLVVMFGLTTVGIFIKRVF